MTYNNPEMNGLAFLKFPLRPWLVLIESELTALLPDRQYVQFNSDAVVRADIKTRYDAHWIGLTAGFLTVMMGAGSTGQTCQSKIPSTLEGTAIDLSVSRLSVPLTRMMSIDR